MKAFQNALVYVGGEGLKKTNLLFGERIVEIGGEIDGAEVVSLPENAVVLPGFIDEHIHGAGGADAMDASEEALATIANAVAAEGTTGFLATTMTQSKENITAALAAVASYRKKNAKDGARVLGVHLEGPFIAAAHKGAQPLEYVAAPDPAVFDEYYAASGESIKIVTLAPEEKGGDVLVAHLAKLGVTASIGHTGAKTADVLCAVENGATNVTHTYNAQSPLHHREIGTVGSALLYDCFNCELIADTIHVSVPAMKLLAKCKPKGKLTLITDAMRAKGLPDGESELGGQRVIVKNGEARLSDGTLAGSVLRMNYAIRNLTQKVGVPFTDAVDCATIVPARTLKIDGEVGSIQVGKCADFAVLDENFEVVCTVRGGNVIYRR